jgi:hypothetical protein
VKRIPFRPGYLFLAGVLGILFSSPVPAETVYTLANCFHIDTTWTESINGYTIQIRKDGPATASLSVTQDTRQEIIIQYEDTASAQTGSAHIGKVWENSEYRIRIDVREIDDTKYSITIREADEDRKLFLKTQTSNAVSIQFRIPATSIRPQ